MTRKSHITIFVSNDLTHDQRVAKVCQSLISLGIEVTLVGRRLAESLPIDRPYPVRRFKLAATTGVLFYALLNIRFFWYALFCKTDALLANDLDTLPAAYLAAVLRRKKVYYDSHEYFTEAEGLTGHPFKKRIWLRIEKWILPRLSNMYTVNESIASFYRELYHIPVYVVRNVPPGRPLPPLKSRQELGLPADKRLIILQGAYIDPDRGAREAVEAMEFVDNAVLMIIGSGRDLPVVQQMAAAPQLKDRVLFRPKLPFDELQQYTRQADVGLTLDKPVHLNYTYSLPNKIFDYVHAGIPVIASRLPELERLINEYRIGALVDEVTPQKIAAAINTVLSQPKSNWSDALQQCAEANNWQKESEIFTEIYRDLLSDTRA